MRFKDVWRDGRTHIALWATIVPTGVLLDHAFTHHWTLTRMILGMAAVAVVHESTHVLMASRLGWKWRFKMDRSTYWQPAVYLDPPAPLYAREYASIAILPLGPSLFTGYVLAGWFGALVAAFMSVMDMRFLRYELRQERGITQWLTALDGRGNAPEHVQRAAEAAVRDNTQWRTVQL